MSTHARPARFTLWLALALALALALVAPASAADKKVRTFPSADKRGSVLLFKVRGVAPDRILRASVRYGGKTRRVDVRKVRRAAARRSVLRVRVRSAARELARVAAGRLSARAARRKKGRLVVVVDTTPPDTSITGGPSSTTTSTSASFSFSSNESNVSFQCALDGASWTGCASPKSYSGLAEGSHAFSVRAVDAAGNVDATPATRSWTVAAGDSGTTPPPDPGTADPDALLSESFDGPDGVFASGSAFWGTADSGLSENSTWFAEGGTMYRRGGTGWTDSSVFRLWTRKVDLRSIRVEMDLKVNRFTGGTADRPPVHWDGAKLWLHERLRTPEGGERINDANADSGYALEMGTRGGQIYVQKKAPGVWQGGNYAVGGTYFMLGNAISYPAKLGQFERVGAVARVNSDGSVTIQVLRGGQVVHEVTDRGEVGGPPLTGGGRIGIRGDNTDFNVDNLGVRPA